ncbi:MAG TPA: DUF3592 domain-containing protein [Anaerolineales bacterium]|nr:DUF3592 domain-containing protein [Anaerolineales bacterium]
MSNLDKTLDTVGKGVNRLQIGCWTVLANLFFAGFCLWGAYAAYIGWQLQTHGVTTPGTVVRLNEQSDAESGCCTYVPVIDFKVNDQIYTFEGDNASYPPAYEVGEQVDVRYDPTNPNTAQIDSYFERWIFPVIIIPAMIFAAALLNFFMIRAWRRGEAISG